MEIEDHNQPAHVSNNDNDDDTTATTDDDSQGSEVSEEQQEEENYEISGNKLCILNVKRLIFNESLIEYIKSTILD